MGDVRESSARIWERGVGRHCYQNQIPMARLVVLSVLSMLLSLNSSVALEARMADGQAQRADLVQRADLAPLLHAASLVGYDLKSHEWINSLGERWEVGARVMMSSASWFMKNRKFKGACQMLLTDTLQAVINERHTGITCFDACNDAPTTDKQCVRNGLAYGAMQPDMSTLTSGLKNDMGDMVPQFKHQIYNKLTRKAQDKQPMEVTAERTVVQHIHGNALPLTYDAKMTKYLASTTNEV